MPYHIETIDYFGQWSPETVGHPNDFVTEADAQNAIEQLKSLGSEWEDGEYRIVETDMTSEDV